jgi:hypothetical protein
MTNLRWLRLPVFLLAAAQLFLGAGFASGASWALALWPWPDGPLSYRFVGAMLLAQGATMAWTAATLALDAARGGVLGFAASTAGIAGYTAWLYLHRNETLLLTWAVVCAGLALGALVLFVLGPRFPRTDRQPISVVVRGSFLVFATALSIATAALLAQAPIVFPWALRPDSSVMFGFLFLASAIYFFDGWLRPGSDNACGQLIGFLVYDLVLFPPYLAHWPKTVGGFRVSMTIYLIVLTWSAVLAIGYLLRRQWRPSTPSR